MGLTFEEPGLPGDRMFLAATDLTAETWLSPSPEGSDRVYDQVADDPEVLDVDQAAWVAAVRPRLSRPPTLDNDPGTLSPWELFLDSVIGHADAGLARERALLRTAPTEPEALDAWLRERVARDAPTRGLVRWCPLGDPRATEYGCPADVKVFRAGSALLTTPIAAPSLRAALFRVLAELDGIELRDAETDEAGRQGTAAAMTVDGIRYELLFDPETSTLLATRVVLLTAESPDHPDPRWPRVPAGTTVELILHLESRIVDAAEARD